jgi:type II secretory pathway pseudopilin PulG
LIAARARRHALGSRRASAYTLVEVLVAMAVLLAGVVAILQVFPISLRSNEQANLVTAAALLGQQKVEEIRRDRDFQNTLIRIAIGTNPETARQPFPNDQRLTYSFSDRPLRSDVPFVPGPDPQAWIIVRAAPGFDPEAPVLFQAQFDQ